MKHSTIFCGIFEDLSAKRPTSLRRDIKITRTNLSLPDHLMRDIGLWHDKPHRRTR